jgi:hypothetical protein
MKSLHPSTVVPTLALMLVAVAAAWSGAKAEDTGDQAMSVTDAVAKGKATLSFRYRFESVDQDGFDKDAEASTLRTRLGLETAEYKDFGLLVQFSNVTVIGSERYNSTRNNKTEFPVVADPDGTEVNQAYLSYSPKDADMKLGRQRVVRDNQRFIGGVAWRQNEQTFDSITLGGAVSDWRLDYGYIWEVKRIFGPDDGVPPADFDSDSHIFNVRLGSWPRADLRAYGYLLDLENAPAASNSTYGVRLTGKRDLADDAFMDYAAEYAHQSDYGDNPSDYTADYYLLELGGGVDVFSAKLGWEVLGGDQDRPGQKFVTPLATLHKFQGWADKFLTTPDAGVDDRYIALKAKFLGATASLIYHKFEAEAGSQKFGDEWDVSLAKSFAKRHKFLLKYADYKADTFATDTTKWWLQYLVSFP